MRCQSIPELQSKHAKELKEIREHNEKASVLMKKQQQRIEELEVERANVRLTLPKHATQAAPSSGAAPSLDTVLYILCTLGVVLYNYNNKYERQKEAERSEKRAREQAERDRIQRDRVNDIIIQSEWEKAERERKAKAEADRSVRNFRGPSGKNWRKNNSEEPTGTYTGILTLTGITFAKYAIRAM